MKCTIALEKTVYNDDQELVDECYASGFSCVLH